MRWLFECRHFFFIFYFFVVSVFPTFFNPDLNRQLLHCCTLTVVLFYRPPERRHGYEQQFHSITAQPEHEPLEAKRPRMETIAEAHIARTPSTAGSIVLAMPHTVQDSLRANMEVKKVCPALLLPR